MQIYPTVQSIFYWSYIYSICNSFSPKSPGGQSLCRKSTSGWTVARVFYGAGQSPKRQKYVQLLSGAACGRCNRYCPINTIFFTLNRSYLHDSNRWILSCQIPLPFSLKPFNYSINIFSTILISAIFQFIIHIWNFPNFLFKYAATRCYFQYTIHNKYLILPQVNFSQIKTPKSWINDCICIAGMLYFSV